MKILVTGASGFVGSAVMRRLLEDGHQPIASTLRLEPDTNWHPMLEGIDVIVHCAARVHVMHDYAADPLAAFRRINVEGTVRLAQEAADAGVKRFIFLSSIKVNGETTSADHPFTAEDTPAPKDAYAQSKLEAEIGLQHMATQSAMQVVILRPPLVYGPGVKGNMTTLMQMVARGLPLPLGSIHNKRSLVALDNLVDLVSLCIAHPAAANQLFLVSDGEDMSTSELVRSIARTMRKPSRLIPFPPTLLKRFACFVRKSDMADRLCDSLQVDITKTKNLLGWFPTTDVYQGISKMLQSLPEKTRAQADS